MLSAQNILDLVGLNETATTSAAYSVRKLSSSYNGNAIKVRRSSDNTTQDIGFTAGGDLDVSTLLAFTGSGNDAFVDTWYDQSGNGKNLSQATAINQPRIVSSGSMYLENNKPFIRFFGLAPGNFNSLNLANDMTTTGHLAVVNKFATGGGGFLLGHTSYYYWHSDYGLAINRLISQQHASSSVKNSKIWQNGISISTNEALFNTSLMVQSLVPENASTVTTWNNIGSDRNSGHNTSGGGGYSELIVFASELNTDSRNALTGSQTCYFGTITSLVPDVPVITAVNYIDNNSASLSFTQTLSSLAPAVTNYQYSTNNGASWTNLSPAATTSPITVTGLASSIQLRAINSVGNSCPAITILKLGITRNGQKTPNNAVQLDKNGNNTNTINPINVNGKINQFLARNTEATIPFETYFDFESASSCTGSNCNNSSPTAAYDLTFAAGSGSVRARMWWNERYADMALVYDKTFDQLNASDIARYYYCEHINDGNTACVNKTDTPPIDFIGIYKTNSGNYYAVKYVSETSSGVTFQYRKLN